VRHERDVSNIRLAVRTVNRDQTSTIAQLLDSSGAQAGSTPGGRAERTVEAERRALTPPSTASQFTRDGRVNCGNQEKESDRQLDREIRRAIAVNDRLRIAANCAPDCRVDLRPDPKSIVHDIGVRKPSRGLRHAAGTLSDP
jgi:hypothetical protein